MKPSRIVRKKTREMLLRLVFQAEQSGSFSDTAKDVFLKDQALWDDLFPCDEDCADTEPRFDAAYFEYAFSLLKDHLYEIDAKIASASAGWKLGRMSRTDLAVLRLATAEIMYMTPDISERVSVNEAVELSKTYGGVKSSAFVNGVLGNIVSGGGREI